MPRIVACSHCGAPHRPARGQTRTTCEWCGGENTVTEQTGPEELVVTGEIDAARVKKRVEVTLVRRGVSRPHVVVGEPRWLAQWQVVGEDGESIVRCGTASPDRLEAGLDLPTAAFRSVDPDDPGPRGLPARGAPEVDAEEILAAARATFADSEQPIATVRLIWTPVCDVRAHTPGGAVEGIYRAGADEVVLGPLPAGATWPPNDPVALAGFASFFAVCFGVGVVVDDPITRAVMVALAGISVLLVRSLLTATRPRGTS